MRRVGQATPVTAEEAAALFLPLMAGEDKARVLLAVSGGPDSTALMGLYAEARQIADLPEAQVATVDHGLRAEARAEAEDVGRQAARLGFIHHILTWDGEKPVTRLQELAREERYRLLGQLLQRQGAGAIATAHTLDDQAETILMRMARGSGPAGLIGIQPLRVFRGLTLLRPFLGLPKARLVATCRNRGWGFVADPGNANPDFQRVRMRALMPALAREGLTPARLATFSARMTRMQEALAVQARQVIGTIAFGQRGRTAYDAVRLAGEPDEIILLVLRMLMDTMREDIALEGPIRLSRLEMLAEKFTLAARAGAAFAGTLGGIELRLRDGILTLAPEKPRKH